MKTTDPRLNDTRITDGSGNVFVDLGFDAAEAQVLALRVELMAKLQQELARQAKPQVTLAKQLGVTQPRISSLQQGKWRDFSVDMLLTLATKLGLRPQLRFA